MAESDLNRTEAPTPRRLQKARMEGRVPRSRELVTFVLLVAGILGTWALSGQIVDHCEVMLRSAFSFDHSYVVEPHRMLGRGTGALHEGLYVLLPLLALTGAAAVLSPIVLSGWVLTLKPLGFNFSRLDPVGGLKRIFSFNGTVQVVLSTAKIVVIGTIGGAGIWLGKGEIFALSMTSPAEALTSAAHLVYACVVPTIVGLFAVALIDVPWQLWNYRKNLRMTKEEVKREHRESEGDPKVKGRIRAQQRAMARRRMMSQVPKADVVVTNPTTFAVAIRYADGQMRAPKVVAKGSNAVAARIREVAAEHSVPMLEAPPLARALYHNVELEQEIPSALYSAVAEVLAWVYQLRRYVAEGGDSPVAPTDLDVPVEMDKGAVTDEESAQEAADVFAKSDHDRGEA